MHIDSSNPLYEYTLNKQVLSMFNKVKDLEITVDNTLSFNLNIDATIARACWACSSILYGFYNFILMIVFS